MPLSLSYLEKREARLLSWGVVDGAFSEDEIREHLQKYLNNTPDDIRSVDEIRDSLMDRCLLHEFLDGHGDSRYRTRMAETVRLLVRLRQLWPNDTVSGRWRGAATLVSDYRFMLRERSRPRRDTEAAAFLRELAADDRLGLTPRQLATGSAILGADGQHPWTLARFQADATRRILTESAQAREKSSGTIICAGTGSGKTLAFYLPVLMHIAENLDDGRFTRCLALYPRQELLKDQFSETYQTLLRLPPYQGRSITIGSFFGGTPIGRPDTDNYMESKGWRRVGNDYICPFLSCPASGCSGPMVWLRQDWLANRHVLTCANPDCHHQTPPGTLVLTRQAMQETPPDILFTTTEMLNQRLSDYSTPNAHALNRLFGVGVSQAQRPRLILLDEVHIYEGPHGAQVGRLLRRWRQMAWAAPHFVGLSATLLDAPRFFAQLTGCREDLVVPIEPAPCDMRRYGMEYMLALKGDSVSGQQLLSTTIQTSMLMRRVLDTREGPTARVSQGLYGTRVFSFTDNLDVANRLFFYLRDAEGLNSWGNPISGRSTLTAERDSALAPSGERRLAGQSWDLPEEIGHSTNRSQFVERTTSQDPGLADRADTVVATASLEVGYNDPEVGCIIQHKTPHSSAQFLQRKGRAGRSEDMRPWTVVVLSDFGRDRFSFHSYERLFDPELQARFLPLGNIHILRMQGTYALMNWVGQQLQFTYAGGNVWSEWTGRRNAFPSPARLHRTLEILRGVLQPGSELHNQFCTFLRYALGITDAVVSQLLWDPPRSILRHVIPTLLRRLETQWSTFHGGPWTDHCVGNNPLPEFVASTLFSDLNVPELIVHSPAPQVNLPPREDPMGVLQGLREYAPGRVSHRFGVANMFAGHWIDPQLDGANQPVPLDVSGFCGPGEYLELGHFSYWDDNQQHTIRCIRPLAIHATQSPQAINDSSNAFQDWRCQMEPLGEGISADVPPSSSLASVVDEVRFYMHTDHSAVEVRRFATGARCSLSGNNLPQAEGEVVYQDNHTPVGIGCAFSADGILVRTHMPEDLYERIVAHESCCRGMRTARFTEEVAQADCIPNAVSVFQRDWLARVFFTALVYHAIEHDCSLEDACGAVAADNGSLPFSTIIGVIYQTRQQSAVSPGQQQQVAARNQQELLDSLGHPETRQALADCARALWEPWDTPGWGTWFRRCFAVTLIAGLKGGVVEVGDDVDEQDLIVDIEWHEDSLKLWLTEAAVGGVGIVERAWLAYCEDPTGFFLSWANQYMESPETFNCHQLARLVRLLPAGVPDTLQAEACCVRNAGRIEDLESAYAHLKEVLRTRGFRTDHALMSSMGHRLLRPGTSHTSDLLVCQALNEWEQWEDRLGVEIEPLVAAIRWRGEDCVDAALGLQFDDELARYYAVVGILWPRGREVRNGGLALYSPFSALPDPELGVVACMLQTASLPVRFEAGQWQDEIRNLLRTQGRAELSLNVPVAAESMRNVVEFVSQPVPWDCFLFYPRLVSCVRGSANMIIELELMEVWGEQPIDPAN